MRNTCEVREYILLQIVTWSDTQCDPKASN